MPHITLEDWESILFTIMPYKIVPELECTFTITNS